MSVVAGDSAVLRSLEFSLRAEGFDVQPHSNLQSAEASADGASCLVVDDDVLKDGTEGGALGRIGAPVVLLADPLRPSTTVHAARVLIKPYIGLALIDTVIEVTR